MKKFQMLLCLVYATYCGKLLYPANQKMMGKLFPSKSYVDVARIIRKAKNLQRYVVDDVTVIPLPKGSVLAYDAHYWYWSRSIKSKPQIIPEKYWNACNLLVFGKC